MAEYLNQAGLQYVLEKLKQFLKPPVKTTQQWFEDDTPPELGQIIVYSDAPIGHDEQGNVITGPRTKIGDGVNLAKNLKFSENTQSMQALHIGNVVYDGSEEKWVPVYDGTDSLI